MYGARRPVGGTILLDRIGLNPRHNNPDFSFAMNLAGRFASVVKDD
jgi:hypothetical protein